MGSSSPHKAAAKAIRIRESRVPRLHAPSPGLSQLGTPFVSARAEPSTGWHRMAKQIQLTPEPSGTTKLLTHSFIRTNRNVRLRPYVYLKWRVALPTMLSHGGASSRITHRGLLEINLMDSEGFEPSASALQRRRSATEL